MAEPNPFRVLEFTPALVRLLQRHPAHLLKVAEAHRRYIGFSTHPDRVVGGDARASQINEAVQALKDPTKREQAMQEFLAVAFDGDRELFAPALRETRTALQLEQEARRIERQRGQSDLGRIEEFLRIYAGALIEWLAASAKQADYIEIRNAGRRELVLLRSVVLVVASERPGCLTLINCGPARRVYRRAEVADRQLKEDLRRGIEVVEDHRRERVILGSWQATGSRPRTGVASFPQKAEGLAEFAVSVRPYLEVGKPVVILELASRLGTRYEVTPPLREYIRGRTMKLEKFLWSTSPPRGGAEGA